jgi:PiT family inorganic phosphate transporter
MLYFIPILLLTLVFGYLNSLNGAASIVATLISSRALSPRKALILAALCMCAGPFVLGAAVAGTVGADMVAPEARTADILIAALVGAIFWVLVAVWMKIPSSTTHAFVGSLVGAVVIGFGHDAVLLPGLTKTLVALMLSPVLGIVGGYWLVKLCYSLSADASPQINHTFKRGQVVVCALMAVAYGANDGQKIMGILAFGLVATKLIHNFDVPAWVVVFSALTLGLGAMLGSWRLINVLGNNLYRIRPVHGFGAQVASGTILLSASLLGGPVSTSQVITSAIVGAGSAQRIQQVRWQMVGRVFSAWMFTLPLSALAGGLTYWLLIRLG